MIKIIPPEIIYKYDPNNKQIDGYIYVIVKKVMYGMVQAGIIGHEALNKHLKPYVYAPARTTQGLYANQDRYIKFNLMVDDFGIKHSNKKDVDHLIARGSGPNFATFQTPFIAVFLCCNCSSR